MPGQRHGTGGRGPPSQSGHRRQSISSLRSLRFAAWSLAVPLAGGPERCSATRRPPCSLAASSSAQRQWRSLGARSMLDARSFMISTLRSQVGFAAAVAHARLRLSRLELIGGSGPLAAPPAATRLPRAPSFRRPPSSRRGEALWERVEAGSGLLGAAFSESAAGSGR